MWDGLHIIKAVIDAGAAIKVLGRSYIDLTTPMGRGFMAMMSTVAEDERLRIIKRTHEGRKIARRGFTREAVGAHRFMRSRKRWPTQRIATCDWRRVFASACHRCRL
jgi:DNA invertase Pin-like site-specific DNA recombinase